jgi:hypothetical protein
MAEYIEEELTLLEFADRFLNLNEFDEVEAYDTSDLGIEVLTLDESGNEVYRLIKSFVVKDAVSEYYTDGKIKVTGNHRFIENGKTIFANEHSDFTKVVEDMCVVDIEVDELHSYLANGRLNHNTTSGGKALPFHASVRLRLKNIGTIKGKDIGGKERIIGIKVRAQVIKNRMGPPLRAADFDIFFDRGIDNYGSWLTVLKDNGLVKQSGAWYTYVDTETGEEVKFQSKEFIKLLEDRHDIAGQMYGRICDTTVLKYKKKGELDDLDLDDLVEDNEVIE